ncbi:MAG: polysaccharide deacetylase family protein [Pirellulaceae bacterium]
MRLIPVSLQLIACTIVLQGTISQGEAGTPPARYLIIHADDAGMSHSANRGTIDAMEQGIVSSASIMVPCPWFVEIAEYARAHPERDFGIHLTLNCEWKRYRWGPVASRDKVPSLVDRDGYLWSNVRQVAEHAKTDEVEIELRAQIDRAKEFSVPITHLDTHMGSILARPDLIGIYVQLAIEYDVPILFLRTIDEEIAKEYPALAEQGRKLQSVLEAHQLPMLDQMAQLYGEQPGRTRPQAYLETLRDLSPGVSQLIIHCGYDDAELRAITGSAAQRDEDRRVFSDPEVITFIKEQNIQVITWKQFRVQKSK